MISLGSCLGDLYNSLLKDKHDLSIYQEMGALLGIIKKKEHRYCATMNGTGWKRKIKEKMVVETGLDKGR